MPVYVILFFFFFNDTATTEIYTLSLHDALPIFGPNLTPLQVAAKFKHDDTLRAMQAFASPQQRLLLACHLDRKSTRLNSSHLVISYAVFCLKKKKRYLSIHDLLLIESVRAPSVI